MQFASTAILLAEKEENFSDLALIETLNLLQDRGLDCSSLTENVDATTPDGKLIFRLMGALAEFERDLIHEGNKAGLVAAKASVCRLQAEKTTDGKVALERHLYYNSKQSSAEICSMVEISRSTFFRHVRGTWKTLGTPA